MTKPAIIGALAGLALGALPLAGCARHGVHHAVQPVVGAWVVRDAGAPFPYHMYVFTADGTTQQANPDAGDPHTSDSDGKGLWVADGEGVRGKWVEVVADRTTREYAGRTEVSYQLKVSGDSFTGTESASVYDAAGKLTSGPTPPAAFEGKRVTLP